MKKILLLFTQSIREEVKIKENKVDISAVDSYGRTALISTTEINGNIDELIKSGSDVNVKDGDDMTALMYAAQNGSITNVKKLIKAGSDVDAVDISGLTALMYASIEGADDVVKELINNGANVNIRDYIGWTALKYASNDSFHPEIIKALKAAGAK
jgi:ankyrin repeat protein